MDIVGPLPRSRSGHRYIPVICDYSIRYPEAILLQSVDAEHIAEVYNSVSSAREGFQVASIVVHMSTSQKSANTRKNGVHTREFTTRKFQVKFSLYCIYLQ